MAVELERDIRRGGVYWVRSDGYGVEMASGRPAVIVSNDYGNQHGVLVNVAYCTTQIKPHSCNVNLSCTDKPSMVMCNQVFAVDKGRLGTKLGQCSDEEMQLIDETLAMVFGLTLHKRDVDVALEETKAQVASLEEELVAKRAEIAVVEKMYEKALDMFAGWRVTNDMQTKRPTVVKEQPKAPKLVPDEPEKDEEIESRRSDDTDKVNVNTASAKEISEKTGLPVGVAYGVSAYRKKIGGYRSLDELLNAPRFTQYHLDKFGGKLAV